MVDSAMFYIIGTLYPYVARATYPALGFPQYAGEVGASDADPAAKSAAQKAAAAAVAEPLEVFRKFYMSGKPFIGGAGPSIADIRLAATLEFLAVIDYPLPAWAKSFMTAIEVETGRRLFRARRRRARLRRSHEVAETLARRNAFADWRGALVRRTPVWSRSQKWVTRRKFRRPSNSTRRCSMDRVQRRRLRPTANERPDFSSRSQAALPRLGGFD